MHLRPAFTEHDPARIRAHIHDHPFGVLVTAGPRGIEASHIPFALQEAGDGFVLHGHLAAGNAQCAALDGGDALAVFGGLYYSFVPTEPGTPIPVQYAMVPWVCLAVVAVGLAVAAWTRRYRRPVWREMGHIFDEM